MLGSAIVRSLQKQGFDNLVLRSSKECDLRDSQAVKELFDTENPSVVILAAARVGGIQANINHSAEFLYENLMIQCNVIHQSYLHSVEKFCFLGSSCIYPRECPQPMKEEYLLTGPLEPTNEGYALAKISGLKMVELYRKQYGFNGVSLMPCNLYGTNDSFDPINAHVLSSLVKKIVGAMKENKSSVAMWGSGIAQREFMHVNDAADAILSLMQNEETPSLCNIGWGKDISIKELATKIAYYVDFQGELTWDSSKPDGILRKCMDVTKMKELGYIPSITLDEGIQSMILEYTHIRESLSEKRI